MSVMLQISSVQSESKLPMMQPNALRWQVTTRVSTILLIKGRFSGHEMVVLCHQ